MKAIRKIIIYIVICLTLTTSAFAVNSDCVNTSVPTSVSVAEPNAEKVEWIFVTVDGVRYKRLWSITRGVWLTGWIECG